MIGPEETGGDRGPGRGVGSGVLAALDGAGVSAERLAGTARYDTAVKAAEFVTDRYTAAAGEPCLVSSTIGIARARVPFDSFSAAPLLAGLRAPLMLADPKQVAPDTAGFLDAAREAHDTVNLQIFGGDAAVSQAAITTHLTGEDPASEAVEAEAENGEAEPDVIDPGILPAGTCGGAIDDEPAQLVPSTNAEDAAWSPLGDRITYARRSRDGDRLNSHIWNVNVDGSHNNQRTEGDVVDRWPTWSPDGKKIAFERLFGSLDVELVPHHVWLRPEHELGSFTQAN